MVVPTSLKDSPPTPKKKKTKNKKKGTPNQLFRIWRRPSEILGLLLLSVHTVFTGYHQSSHWCHRRSPVINFWLSARVTGTLRRRQGGAAPRLLSRARALARERRRDAERDLSISCRTRFIPSLVVERILQSFFNHCSDIAVKFSFFFFLLLLLLLLCQSEPLNDVSLQFSPLAWPFLMKCTFCTILVRHSSSTSFFVVVIGVFCVF